MRHLCFVEAEGAFLSLLRRVWRGRDVRIPEAKRLEARRSETSPGRFMQRSAVGRFYSLISTRTS
jgi:hypothetical protein